MRIWLLALVAGAAVVACSTSSGGGDGAPAPVVVAESTIGPAGGTIKAEGVALDIPAGALGSEEKIRVTRTSDAAPAGAIAKTPTFRFEPDGLVFTHPAHVSFVVTDVAPGDVVLWSTPDKSGFDRLPTSPSGTTLSADVVHFSEGLAARFSADVPDASPSEGGSDATTDAPVEGGCQCASGLSCCGSICVSTSTSATNCGGCGKVCGTATPVCINGVCSPPAA